MKMSKKGVICTMWCACLFPAVAAMAEDVVIKAGDAHHVRREWKTIQCGV